MEPLVKGSKLSANGFKIHRYRDIGGLNGTPRNGADIQRHSKCDAVAFFDKIPFCFRKFSNFFQRFGEALRYRSLIRILE